MRPGFDRPLRVITLCSGYDSQCMALERLKAAFPGFDYELVAWSEIDRHAIRAHEHQHRREAGGAEEGLGHRLLDTLGHGGRDKGSPPEVAAHGERQGPRLEEVQGGF